ncbi:MAG: glycosyltransferase family 4 protein [Acidobacteriaceae bacterium]|nr:glycosyltransferase family 4 protein [Acidobacteriaceae bacterium]
MHSVLAYFTSYFDPRRAAPLLNHSAGQIASHLYDALREFGPVTYLDAEDRPSGLAADLYIGHFWNYLPIAEANRFQKRIAFYAVSDPDRRRGLLHSLAARFNVPLPVWDFPPSHFDHAATMRNADLVLVVGNSCTLETFAPEWRPKLRLLNYSVDRALYSRAAALPKRNDLCYVATQCGLRKGFMDVLDAWPPLNPPGSSLHVIGAIEPPWDRLLAARNTGNIVYHGWIDSHLPAYADILGRCRFAYIPTYEEGQMGSLLEAMHCGCVPITTRASGIDDHVLEHAILIEPLDIPQQQAAILDALSWPPEKFALRRQAISAALDRFHDWAAFASGVKSALAELF